LGVEVTEQRTEKSLPPGDEYTARLSDLVAQVNGFVYPGDRADAVVATVKALRADPTLARDLLTTEPRRWVLPSEPGPEVTAVRDRLGDPWRREEKGWRLVRPLGALWSWSTLLKQFSPLTDATPSPADTPGDDAQ
jgi:hypothetical protein